MISKFGFPIYLLMAVIMNLFSCTGTKPGLFSKRSPHAAYLGALKDAGLANTQLGIRWQQAADNSLLQPVGITLPYRETGYFAAESPRAMGYRLNAKRGEQVVLQINTQPVAGNLLFIELWRAAPAQEPELLITADTLLPTINYTVQYDGAYIVRLQPELLQGISYTLTITTAPSLAFPLNKTDNPRVISSWGVDRDAGARRHEGVDILVKKRTPVIAATSGTITSAGENNLGGKVVFLRPADMNIQLYYAHLDTQWVQGGDRVWAGDTLGLTGNTGNAKNTVSHLHFGIYTGSGPVDPLPFINMQRALPPPIVADTQLLNRFVHVQPGNNPATNTAGKVIAAADNRFLLQLPDGTHTFVQSKQTSVNTRSVQLPKKMLVLYEKPDSMAAVKMSLPLGAKVAAIGNFKDFTLISWNNQTGWVNRSDAGWNAF